MVREPGITKFKLVCEQYFPKDPLKLDVHLGRGRWTTIDIPSAEISSIGYSIPDSVKKALERVSQLGLKEVWLGRPPQKHDRWEHSTGAFTVGFIWLKSLEARGVPKGCREFPVDSWGKVKALVGTALLIHDYGHLPFSHLLNEVLEAINWVPQSAKGGGLEAAVLQDRTMGEELEATWKWLANERLGPGSARPVSPDDARLATQALILGNHGLSWLQAIVNSPIDADKIDYIRFDSQFLRDTEHPVRPRVLQERPDQWLADFLSDQEVNHAGLLCLHGRSARAAADLWRDRVFLYDRFYLSPELRVPERIAFEIIQQFIIRSTMSEPFRANLPMEGIKTFSERVRELLSAPDAAVDPVEVKYQAVHATMVELLDQIDQADLEFPILEKMAKWLWAAAGIDAEYKDFLQRGFQCLAELKGPDPKKRLRHLVSESLVQQPLLLHREDFPKARDVIRALQHTYCREAIIDIVRLPRALGAPNRYRAGFAAGDRAGLDYVILVPDGKPSTWGPGRLAKCPLTDECVEELERPYCRVSVIVPGGGHSARAEYVWDRVRSALLEAGLEIIQEMREI